MEKGYLQKHREEEEREFKRYKRKVWFAVSICVIIAGIAIYFILENAGVI